jgi:hypothetical protein
VVELARQLRVDEVGHVQLDQRAAGPALQALLNGRRLGLERAAIEADPDEAALGQRIRQRRQFDEAISADVKGADRGRRHAHRRASSRAASSAK